FNINVADDCNGSTNLIFVPIFVPTAVGKGAFFKAHNLGPYTMSCAEGGQFAEDNILDHTEAAAVNSLLTRMNAQIRAEATGRGLAYFALQDLYGRADIKGPFNVIALMTTAQPYGPLVSLDGVHPSAAGAAILAQAAAHALDATYGMGILSQSALIASK